MGVKLRTLVEPQPIGYNLLEGSVMAIDGPNIVYSLVSFRRKGSERSIILDRTQRPISHLYGIIDRINFLYSKKISPIFCFDGRVSPLKRKVTKDALNDYRFIKSEYANALKHNDTKKMKQIATSSEYFWPHLMEESKSLISALGIPVINSPGAAEAQCAELVRLRIATNCNSQDYDALLFGAPNVIRNFNKSARTYPSQLNLNSVLKRLKISYFQLIDLAILIGTDYNKKIQGIGPKTALKLIIKHKSLENIIASESNSHNFNNLPKNLIRSVRNTFIFPEVLRKFEDIAYNRPNTTKVLDLLCTEHYLNKKRVEKALKSICVQYRKTVETQKKEFKRKSSHQQTLW